MTSVLMSVKPEFSSMILDGSKRFEYRKSIPRQFYDKLLVYSTYPECRVVCEADVDFVYEDDLDFLWNLTSDFSGINKDFFDEYFKGLKKGFAIHLKSVRPFDDFLSLSDIHVRKAPQNFMYVNL